MLKLAFLSGLPKSMGPKMWLRVEVFVVQCDHINLKFNGALFSDRSESNSIEENHDTEVASI
jgi:hypothetical protein